MMLPAWEWIRRAALPSAGPVIASRAVITGAYSWTRQAIQLGLLPRLEIRHTSEALFGQIYMPRVTLLLLVGVLLLVALFRSSSALASAYGIAVTGTMVATVTMAFVVVWKVWNWPPLAAVALIAPFLFIDVTFLGANLLKVVEGGWVPLALGGLVMVVMYTWRRGSRLLFEKTRRQEISLHVLLRFGFMETPNVPRALAIARKHGWQFDIMSTSFFLSRRALKPAAHSGMPRWQDRLFIMLTRIANDATDYFQIPTGRVVEVGTQVTT